MTFQILYNVLSPVIMIVVIFPNFDIPVIKECWNKYEQTVIWNERNHNNGNKVYTYTKCLHITTILKNCLEKTCCKQMHYWMNSREISSGENLVIWQYDVTMHNSCMLPILFV